MASAEKTNNDTGHKYKKLKFVSAIIFVIIAPILVPMIVPYFGISSGWSTILYAFSLGVITSVAFTLFDISKEAQEPNNSNSGDEMPTNIAAGLVLSFISFVIGIISYYSIENRLTASINSVYIDGKSVICNSSESIKINISDSDLKKILKLAEKR